MSQDAFPEEALPGSEEASALFNKIRALVVAVTADDKQETLLAIADIADLVGPFVLADAILRGFRETIVDVLAEELHEGMEAQLRRQVFFQVGDDEL